MKARRLLEILTAAVELADDVVDVSVEAGAITIRIELADDREPEPAKAAVKPPPVRSESTGEVTACADCERTFKSRHAMLVHRSKSHRQTSEPVAKPDTEDPRCDECGQSCTSEITLAAHKKAMHTKPADAKACAVPGCATVVSRYAKSDRCSLHERNPAAKPL